MGLVDLPLASFARPSRLPWAVACLLLSACGGTADAVSTDASADTDLDVSTDAGTAPDGPLGPCEVQGGYAVCGGPNDCFPSPGEATPECAVCMPKTGAVGLCFAENGAYGDDCNLCDDGDVCVDATGFGAWVCRPFAVGQLFASNGASTQVRYTDLSLWTGDALPEPADCAAPAGLTYCGGNCGGCPSGSACTGRSPIHPYGLCVPTQRLAPPNCSSGEVGFIFKVQPAAQALANAYSLCMPEAECATAAASYPGGAICTP
jgi:hypothetical protein